MNKLLRFKSRATFDKIFQRGIGCRVDESVDKLECIFNFIAIDSKLVNGNHLKSVYINIIFEDNDETCGDENLKKVYASIMEMMSMYNSSFIVLLDDYLQAFINGDDDAYMGKNKITRKVLHKLKSSEISQDRLGCITLPIDENATEKGEVIFDIEKLLNISESHKKKYPYLGILVSGFTINSVIRLSIECLSSEYETDIRKCERFFENFAIGNASSVMEDGGLVQSGGYEKLI